MSNHFLQSNYWKQAKLNLGQEVIDINQTHLFLKSTALGRVGYIPRVKLESLKSLDLSTFNLVYCRVDPLDFKNTQKLNLDFTQKFNTKNGLAIQLPKTVIINLTKTEEELKNQMKQKHRYNLKIAEKNNVIVTIGSTSKELDTFFRLYLQTLKRQGYFGRSENYIRTVWDEALKENSAFIATATYNNTPIASWLLLGYKDTLYYPYGGTSEEYRNVMGTYKLVWEIVLWAKGKGYKFFDLYGIEDDQSDGFTRFKLGFVEKDQAQIIEYAQTIDLVLKPLRYKLMRLVENLRNKFKFIKSLS